MKIYIGPYKKWVGPYQIADLFQYIGVSEDRCFEIGHMLESMGWLNYICKKIYDFNQQKVRIRIDKYDTWSMDGTLALIMLPMLKQLRDTKHGSPCDMLGFQQTSNSAQHCFDFYAEGDDLADQAGHQQWVDIIDQMIWSFEQIVDDNYYINFDRQYHQKIQTGLELFGRYYLNLWD